ncbi:hypothetical protein [Spirochaeta isovalerica]|uniref:Uncharacterized protein n=1 Tax=Spirochaeta isovalerica TaxID=150 RepID=A0A841RGB5_9SPIO|nr:hypothetical protein [Spirochaeta isovalerica]MBB6482050.1 hypothetical protein [Spirochaeta isovalerica]
MSDFDYDDQDDLMSLDDLDDEENSDYFSGSDDWGDSYDDMDSEAWDREYRGDDVLEELEDDPWALS